MLKCYNAMSSANVFIVKLVARVIKLKILKIFKTRLVRSTEVTFFYYGPGVKIGLASGDQKFYKSLKPQNFKYLLVRKCIA